MTVLSDYISRMTEAGIAMEEATQMVAEIFAAGAANAVVRSPAAVRQKRYRDKCKTVTKRNETVTTLCPDDRNETVTNRNESVTSLRPANSAISLTTTSIDNLEKKERKKERIPKKRYAPLPENWTPSLRSFQVAEQHGVNVQIVEQIFRDYLKSSGKLYADYDAAFNNFLRNQQHFNGRPGNGTHQPQSDKSLIGSIKRELAELEGEEGADPALPARGFLRVSS